MAKGFPREKRSRPDLDKLIRAVGDALTGVLWTDDAQIVTWSTGKGYVDSDPCMRLSVMIVEEAP
jgi:Holliday junction resolvase RusA-like endonuclease